MYKEIYHATVATDPHYIGNGEGGPVWGERFYVLVEFKDGRRFASQYGEISKVRHNHEEFGFMFLDVAKASRGKVIEWMKTLYLSEFDYAGTLEQHFRETDPCYGSSAFQSKEATEGAFLDR